MADSIRKRTGNDIEVLITVSDADGSPIDLSDGYRYELWLQKRFGGGKQVSHIGGSPSEGTLRFVWKASEQTGCGEWTVLLKVFDLSSDAGDGCGRSADRVQAITLTEHTRDNTDSDNKVIINFTI